jgi:hypothetical protein
MAESTLSLAYDDFRKAIGHYLGFKRDTTAWTTDQSDDIEDALASGLRQFYIPPPIGDPPSRYEWSFLKPIARLEINANNYTYLLPDDFGSIIGEFSYDVSLKKRSVAIITEERIRSLRSKNNRSGDPLYAAIRVVARAGAMPQRFEVLFYPSPDTDRTLEYQFAVNPPKLTTDSPNPLGGMVHSETILESCLAIAEARINDEAGGLHFQKFMQLLSVSILSDRSSASPSVSGSWPIEDEDDSMQVTYKGLLRQVGRVLGYGWDHSTWTHPQQSHADFMVQEGLRTFYMPPPIPGEQTTHIWTFIRPFSRVDTSGNQFEYQMPKDFGGLDGQISYTSSTVLYRPIKITGPTQIYRWRQGVSNLSDFPQFAAIEPRVDSIGQQTFWMLLWPTPNQVYELLFRYFVLSRKLSDMNPLPLGGQSHSQTILLSCLAAAEKESSDRSADYHGRFMQQLSASVTHDRKMSQPDLIGFNLDRSDGEFPEPLFRSRIDTLYTGS